MGSDTDLHKLYYEIYTHERSAVASTEFHDMERGFETDALDEAVCIPVMDRMQTLEAW